MTWLYKYRITSKQLEVLDKSIYNRFGFHGAPFAWSDNDSFHKTKIEEGACPSKALGLFASDSSPFPVGDNINGHFFWPILWMIHVLGNLTNSSYTLNMLNRLQEYDSGSRNLIISKGGACVNRTVPNP